MKNYFVHRDVRRNVSEVKAARAAMKDTRRQQDMQRRKMLTVNPNARLATVYGATFVM